MCNKCRYVILLAILLRAPKVYMGEVLCNGISSGADLGEGGRPGGPWLPYFG